MSGGRSERTGAPEGAERRPRGQGTLGELRWRRSALAAPLMQHPPFSCCCSPACLPAAVPSTFYHGLQHACSSDPHNCQCAVCCMKGARWCAGARRRWV